MKFLFFFLISYSFIGYGIIIRNFLQLKILDFGSLGILGITFVSIIAFLSSLFFYHGYIFNSIILLIGLLFLIFNIRDVKNIKKEIFSHFLIFLTLCLFILIAKNHDDFPYYHFPYIALLAEFSHPIGIGQLNNGFRSPSSIFFVSSLFNLPSVNIYLFHILPAIILGFINLILLNKISDQKIFNSAKIINLLSLSSLIFINIFFYRLSEHGTDRSGMILIILAIIYLISLVKDQKTVENLDDMKMLTILICFVATIKPFYLLSLLLLIVLFIYPSLRKKFLSLFFTRTFFYCSTLIISIIFYTFINSGCLIFPVSFTCFENLSWSIDKQQIKDIKVWFELWSKAGASPNYIVEDRLSYISQFNWISNWIDNYFFNKVSDFLLGLVTLSLILIIVFYNNDNYRFKNIKNIILVYFIIFVLFLEWFWNHPTLRYGGYHLIFLLILIPINYLISSKDFSFNFYFKRALSLVLITFVIFVFRNYQRLNYEIEKYNFNPLVNSNFIFTEDKNFYFRYNNYIKENIKNFKMVNFGGKNFLITINKYD